MSVALTRVFVVGAALAACARPPPAAAPRASRTPPSLAAVVRVRGVGDCLGVRVAPGAVLTAAHCVLGVRSLAELRVVAGDAAGGALPVSSCALHPALGPRFERCDVGDRDAPRRLQGVSADLALLALRGDPPGAPTLPLVPAGLAPGELRGAEAWVVSRASPTWVDGAASQASANEVTVADEEELRTENPEAGCISTRPGDSGGPLLVRRGGRWAVAGVLAGGDRWYSGDSHYAPTFTPSTAAWLAGR